MSLASTLLKDFNAYRYATRNIQMLADQGETIYSFKENKKNMAILDDTIEFCRERSIEPRLWIFSLFKQRKWVFAPRLLPGHLMSETHVPKYRKMQGLGFFRKRVSMIDDGIESYDPNRDINVTIEALKKRYASSEQHERCFDELMLRTLGFHPKSATCVVCPFNKKCAVSLQSMMRFDIIALREGRLTAREAENYQCQKHP